MSGRVSRTNKVRTALMSLAVAVSMALAANARDAVTYLEYVESKGRNASTASFVHLEDVKPEGDWKIAVDFSVAVINASQSIFTCKDSKGGNRLICVYNIKDSGMRVDVNNVKGATGNGGLSDGKFPTPGLRQTVVYDAGDLYLDGVQIASFKEGVGSVTGSNVNPITIFGDRKDATDWTNFTQGRLYGVKMWNGEGALVHELHPCINADDIAGLYDSMTCKFYESEATTAFTAGPVAAPDGVEFLEYVETKVGNTAKIGQYFNTEYVPSYDCKIEMDVTLLTHPTNRNVTFFRSNTSSDDYNYLSLFSIKVDTNHLETTGLRLDMGLYKPTDTTYTGQTYLRLPPMRNVRRTYVYDKGVLSIDGEVIVDNSNWLNTSYLAANPNQPLTIGGSYDNKNDPVTGNIQNLGAFRFYRVRIWDGSGNLKRDLRPARDAAGNNALYDLVNGKFHYHLYRPLNDAGFNAYHSLTGAGTPDFPAGPELDCLESAGNVTGGKQWYDTGYIPTGRAKIEMDATPLQGDATYAWFAANPTNSGNNGNMLNVFNIKGVGMRLDIAGNNKRNPSPPVFPEQNKRSTVVYDGGILSIDGTQVTDLSTDAMVMGSAGWRTYLLMNGAGPTSTAANNLAKMKVYSVKIWDSNGGTLVRDFVPRRTASGFVGLYDKVGDKFYKSGNDIVTVGRGVSAEAGTDNAPTAAQIEAAGDVLESALLVKTGSKIAGGFAQKVEESVACPFAGTAKTAFCASFPQSFTVTADGEGTNVVTATTGLVSLGKPFTSTEGTSWTAVLRVKREAKGVDVADTVLSLGSDCAKDGVKIGFCGSEANRRLDVCVGSSEWPELSGFAAPAGEWLDIAVTVDAANNTVRVYCCRENGSLIWSEKTFTASVGSDSIVNLAARSTWSVNVGGEASVSNAEVGRISNGKWIMFDDALKAFKGSVERVALWKRKLSDAEVSAAFKALPKSDGLMIIVR